MLKLYVKKLIICDRAFALESASMWIKRKTLSSKIHNNSLYFINQFSAAFLVRENNFITKQFIVSLNRFLTESWSVMVSDRGPTG